MSLIPLMSAYFSSLAIWLRPMEREIATRRLEVWRRKSPNAINLRTFKQIVKSPIVYHLSAIYAGMLIAVQGTQCKSGLDCLWSGSSRLC